MALDPAAVGALGELIATAVAATTDRSWQRIRSSPEAKAVKDAIDRALVAAFRDARRDGVAADDEWAAAVAGIWRPAFTTDVSQALISCLAEVTDGGQRGFADRAARALHDSGCHVVELGRTFWVEQFSACFPSCYSTSCGARRSAATAPCVTWPGIC